MNFRNTLNIARGLIQEKRYNEAESVLLETIENSDNRMIKGQLIDLYIKWEQFDKAEQYIDEMLRDEPSNRYLLQKRGDILVKHGKYSDALDILFDLYKSNRDEYYLTKRIAKIYYLMEDYERALEYAKEASHILPGRGDIFFLISQINERSGKPDDARDSIEKALKLDPENKLYYSRKLSLRMKEKNLNSSNLEELINQSDENNPHLLKLLAEKLKREEKYDEAIQAYKRLISIEESDFNKKLLAFLYYKVKNYTDAFKLFLSLSDSNFLDNIFLSTIIASAKNKVEKKYLADRMSQIARSSPQYRSLWGKIKKISREIEHEGS